MAIARACRAFSNALAKHDAKATFFVPAVAALLYADEQRRVAAEGHEVGIHGWIHELNSQLPYEIERDLMFRAADTLEKIAGNRPVGLRTPSWDFSPEHAADRTRARPSVRFLPHGGRRSLRARRARASRPESSNLPVEWIRDDAVYFNMHRFTGLRPHTPADGSLRHLLPRIRAGLRRRRPLPAHHASACDRISLANLDSREAAGGDHPATRCVDRHSCGNRGLREGGVPLHESPGPRPGRRPCLWRHWPRASCNSIADVPGVRVGHRTLVRGDLRPA